MCAIALLMGDYHMGNRETDLEYTIKNAIENAPVGQEFNFMFTGMPKIIDVSFKFHSGWCFNQTISPGQSLSFIKGDVSALESINIDFHDFEGLK